MTWLFIVHDPEFNDPVVNGGTSYQFHLAHTLEWAGHNARLISINSKEPWPDADFVFLQSEWWEGENARLQEARRKGAKLICWIGHFIGGNYFDPNKIDADFYVTTWKGPILNSVPGYRERIAYLPHAYCSACDKDVDVKKHDLLFIGTPYPLRDESWFDKLNISRPNGINPSQLGSYYRRATVCLNLHGGFQKGEVSDHPSRLATKPGLAVNERLFGIAGAGGFQVCDWSPLIEECYSSDEVVMCRTKEEYRSAVLFYLAKPDKRIPFIEKARKRTLQEHTYANRINDLIKIVNA